MSAVGDKNGTFLSIKRRIVRTHKYAHNLIALIFKAITPNHLNNTN